MCEGSCQTRTLALLGKAYESIPPQKAAEYLGLSTDTVIPGAPPVPLLSPSSFPPPYAFPGYVLILALQQEKWTFDAEKNLLILAKEERRITPLFAVRRGS